MPMYRLTAEECLKHDWFKKYENQEEYVPLTKDLLNNMKKFKVKLVFNSFIGKKRD